jgi:hypothetical protein
MQLDPSDRKSVCPASVHGIRFGSALAMVHIHHFFRPFILGADIDARALNQNLSPFKKPFSSAA